MDKVLGRETKNGNLKLIDKLLAHQKGWQHYAVSVFIFNKKQELLLQKRASQKYHSPNLWTNTCCSHPLSTELEQIKAFAEQRLNEEMGFTTTLKFLFDFQYNVKCSNNLIENEVDFVFVGVFDKDPSINVSEVSEFKWVDFNTLQKDIYENATHYTEWLKIILKQYKNYFGNIHNYI